MDYMFQGCTSLKELNLSNFDMSNANELNSMFKGCVGLKSLEMPAFGNIQNGEEMFNNCQSLITTITINGSISRCNEMFSYAALSGKIIVNYTEGYEAAARSIITRTLSNRGNVVLGVQV